MKVRRTRRGYHSDMLSSVGGPAPSTDRTGLKRSGIIPVMLIGIRGHKALASGDAR
jgi:hypothetical protein